MQNQFLPVNGLKVAYLQKGSGKTARSIVFIHGYPFAKEMWEMQLNALPGDLTGYAYDIRGFGSSETDHRFFSIDLFAQDLIAFVKALDLENCFVCGISMGGYIALRAMELEPGLFGGLLLADTTSMPDPDSTKLSRFKGIETLVQHGLTGYTGEFLKKVFAADTLNNNPEVVQKIRDMIHAGSVASYCSALLAMASRTETTPVLAKIAVPCLVVRGENDQVIPPEQAEALQRAIPGASFFTVPHCGHLPNLEQPELFNARMLQFLSTGK